VGVPRGPLPRSLTPAGPIITIHAPLPSARLSAVTALWRPFEPCTKMRSPVTAREPYPAPRFATDHTIGGPAAGHAFISPVSRDRPERSGPRHCGQSEDGLCA